MNNLPRFFDLWHNYPDYDSIPSPKMKAMVGGKAGAMSDPDTCGLRMSLTFIRCNHPLPKRYSGAYLVPGGKTGQIFMVRIRDWLRYLSTEYFKPTKVAASLKKDGGFDKLPDGFRMRGVICFWWGGGGGADGHIDIWNGSSRAGHPHLLAPGTRNYTGVDRARVADQHWNEAKKVYLWEAMDVYL